MDWKVVNKSKKKKRTEKATVVCMVFRKKEHAITHKKDVGKAVNLNELKHKAPFELYILDAIKRIQTKWEQKTQKLDSPTSFIMEIDLY